MSTKNFVSYGDAETLFTGVGNKISGKQTKPTTISYADWLLLTPQQQETGNWLVTGVPGANLSARVLALETGKADTGIVAADFNAGTSYTAGNYCIYDGKFYKFKNNHSGAWSSADVDEIKIAGELSGLNSKLTDLGYTYVALQDGQYSAGDTEIAEITLNAGEVLEGYININVREGGTFNLKARISVGNNTDRINYPTVTCNTQYDFVSLPFKFQLRSGTGTVHIHLYADNAVYLAFGGYYYRKFKA